MMTRGDPSSTGPYESLLYLRVNSRVPPYDVNLEPKNNGGSFQKYSCKNSSIFNGIPVQLVLFIIVVSK